MLTCHLVPSQAVEQCAGHQIPIAVIPVKPEILPVRQRLGIDMIAGRLRKAMGISHLHISAEDLQIRLMGSQDLRDI